MTNVSASKFLTRKSATCRIVLEASTTLLTAALGLLRRQMAALKEFYATVTR
jgi:hypothetical protein